MPTETIGISHDGLMYQGRLVSAVDTGDGMYYCTYEWMYGVYTLFIAK